MKVKKISASLLVALSLCNFINVSAMKSPNGQDQDNVSAMKLPNGKDKDNVSAMKMKLPNGQVVEWLVSKYGKAWLKTVDGQIWLASQNGQSWLKTTYGCMWLKSDESMSWFESTFGVEWLDSPDGKAWVKTSSGTEWLEKNYGYIRAHPFLSGALFAALTALTGSMASCVNDPTCSFSRACTIL